MTTKVNPDPHTEGFDLHPKNNITAVIDELSDLAHVIQSLHRAGFSDEDLSVFAGNEGLAKLDLHGREHGFLAHVMRAVESLTTEERTNNSEIEDALKTARFFVRVRTDGGDEQKQTAECILKAHHAHNLRYFGAWTVEHL
jgi:hypothetical protein